MNKFSTRQRSHASYRVGIAAILLIFLTSGCQREAQPETSVQEIEEVVAINSTEELWAAPPTDWIAGKSVQTPQFRRAEFSPAKESTEPQEVFQERFIVEAMTMDPSLDSIYFIDQLAREQAAYCSGFSDAATFSGYENGYPTTVRLLTCGKHKVDDISRVTLIKTIQGNDYFYVIAREKEAPFNPDQLAADADDLAVWTLHLKTVRVCDQSDPEHPCPKGTDSAGVSG